MPSGMVDSIGTTDWCWSELRHAKARREDRFGTAVMLVGPHGAYLNGWRNASRHCAPDAEDEQALMSAISYDDPGVARVRIPLERDRDSSVLACVEFHKHDWLLPGFGHTHAGR
jgi:hypothetical protein